MFTSSLFNELSYFLDYMFRQITQNDPLFAFLLFAFYAFIWSCSWRFNVFFFALFIASVFYTLGSALSGGNTGIGFIAALNGLILSEYIRNAVVFFAGAVFTMVLFLWASQGGFYPSMYLILSIAGGILLVIYYKMLFIGISSIIGTTGMISMIWPALPFPLQHYLFYILLFILMVSLGVLIQLSNWYEVDGGRIQISSLIDDLKNPGIFKRPVKKDPNKAGADSYDV